MCGMNGLKHSGQKLGQHRHCTDDCIGLSTVRYERHSGSVLTLYMFMRLKDFSASGAMAIVMRHHLADYGKCVSRSEV